MKKNDIRYETYIRILKEELVPAMGCTEPIAISYCAARCRDLLGGNARALHRGGQREHH